MRPAAAFSGRSTSAWSLPPDRDILEGMGDFTTVSEDTAIVQGSLQIGAWQVNPALDEISRDGHAQKLEPRMMRLLCFLAARPGEVRSSDEILAEIWPSVIVSPNSVYQAIAQLRKLLGDSGDQPAYIATVSRKGYRLIAPVITLEEGNSSPPTSSAAPRHTWRLLLLASLAAAIVIAVAAAWLVSRRNATVAPQRSIAVAVLPFSDLSTASDNQPFCDGLTEEILNSLARIPGLRVTGRTSAFRFRDRSVDPQELGRTLGVTHILEGAVRRSDGRLRVSAQLVSARDGLHVWANSFDRPSAGAIALQSEISRAVVDSLQIQLSAASRARLNRGPTETVSAYELYLLGRHQQLQRKPDALARAVDYHRRAIAADPRFALAHAGLADAYMAGYYYQNRALAETAPLVQREVDAALRLDPQLAEAYAAWAVLLTEQFRLGEAVTALERAIAINSNYGEAYLRLGAAHEYAGRPREALAAYDQVMSLDPLHTVLHVRRCLTLQNLGRYAEAERACDRAIELQPEIPNALWARGLSAFAQGDLPAAIRSHEQALARAPHRADIRSELVLLLLDVGLGERARQELEVARRQAGGRGAEVALTGARLDLATGAVQRISPELAALDHGHPDRRMRLDAAHLAFAAGDRELAARLRDAALAGTFNESDVYPDVYAVRWGMCGICALGLFERSRGDATGTERYLNQVASLFDELERNGHRWHGLEYLRATLHAQRGHKTAALASLERAYRMGWRRAWLMRAEPAFAAMRDDRGFQALLARIDPANAQARGILSAQTPTR